MLSTLVRTANQARSAVQQASEVRKMLVAIEGCCHGSLNTIYDSIAQYESRHSRKVDLLLVCGDFQALRSRHDFASLAVPPKYQSLGTFHEYYSGKRQAPVLTIVIGGNHEASNYMWELYHGGWLAEGIYYLGAAGSVLVNGLRIAGASGIYKDHDYHRGHHEKVPYNNSTMRSVYHIRSYDVNRLMQLPYRENTLFMSHDWPVRIPRYGDTPSLLRRKPFFQKEVETDTLGSPPLQQLLEKLQPSMWFAAHLHVKFAAVFEHGNGALAPPPLPAIAKSRVEEPELSSANPDEINIEDDFDDEPPCPHHDAAQPSANGTESMNPDEIAIDDDDEFDEPPATEAKASLAVEESADLVEAVRKQEGGSAAMGVIGTGVPVEDPSRDTASAPPAKQNPRLTKFLALDKPGRGRDFLQFLEIDSPDAPAAGTPPKLVFDPHWLAVSRALYPFLSTQYHSVPLPPQDQMDALIADELARIEQEGLYVPSQQWTGEGVPELVWDKGPIEVERVQRFWPTAPAEGQPGGSPSAWYTNPQTEAFCGMLGIPNKINPAP